MKALELGCSTITFTFERSQRITFQPPDGRNTLSTHWRRVSFSDRG